MTDIVKAEEGLVKAETGIGLPEGFTDLAINVAVESESRGSDYSGFVEAGVKASYLLLQMGAVISSAFENKEFSRYFSTLFARSPERALISSSFSGNISLKKSGDMIISAISPRYKVRISPRKFRVLISYNAGSPLDFSSVLYPFVYRPLNRVEPEKAFPKLERLLVASQGSVIAEGIENLHKEYVELPEILHLWLLLLNKEQGRQRLILEKQISRLDELEEKLR